MARRVFLHVGTPKSGTTFLQSVWWANKDELGRQGLLLPGRGVNHHYWASCVVRGGKQLQHLPKAGPRSWQRLLAATREHDGDVLISHELFSPASADRADAALRELEAVADEVHVLLTVRDLARQIPAEWQQRTKHGRSQTVDDLLDSIRTDPDMAFWLAQDVPAVLDRWSQGLPEERVHVVVLPPAGAPPTALWEQVCEITGVDGAGMDRKATRRNESLGLAEAEAMRRLSDELNQGGLAKSTERLLKSWFAENMLRSSDPEKIVLPASAYPWVVERARGMVEDLAGRGYDVRGDLADLVPSPDPAPGRTFAEVTDDEVAAVTVRALARFVEHEESSRVKARELAGERRRALRAAAAPPPRPAPGLLHRVRARVARRR